MERIYKNASDHKDGVYTRLYRYLLREDIYFIAYQKLYSNKGATTKGVDDDTADGFGKKYVDGLINDLKNGTYKPKPARPITKSHNNHVSRLTPSTTPPNAMRPRGSPSTSPPN